MALISGGFYYHLRALRYSRTLWKPYHRAVETWLTQVVLPVSADTLFVVGVSGGYALPESFLRRFKRVVAIDPDPWAKRIFSRKMSQISKKLSHETGSECELRFVARALRIDELAQLEFSECPEGSSRSAWLFSNLIGQLSLETAPEVKSIVQDWQKNLPEFLSLRSWVSFHDRLSGGLRPNIQDGEVRQKTRPSDTDRGFARAREAEPVSNETLVREFYAGAAGELDDHETENFFRGLMPSAQFHYFVWQLVPGRFHLIEGLSSHPQREAVLLKEAVPQSLS